MTVTPDGYAAAMAENNKGLRKLAGEIKALNAEMRAARLASRKNTGKAVAEAVNHTAATVKRSRS